MPRTRTLSLLAGMILTLALAAPTGAQSVKFPAEKDLPKCEKVIQRPRLQVSPAVIPVGVPTDVTVTAQTEKGKPIRHLAVSMNTDSESLMGTTDEAGRLTWTVMAPSSDALQVNADEDPSVKPAQLFALDSDQSAVAITVADRCGQPLAAEVTIMPADSALAPFFGPTEEGRIWTIQPITKAFVTASAQTEDGQVAYLLHQPLTARPGGLTELTLSAEKLKPTYVHFAADGSRTDGQLFLLPAGVDATPFQPAVQHEQLLYAPEGIYQYLVVGSNDLTAVSGEARLAKHDWSFEWASADLLPLQASATVAGAPVAVRGLGLYHAPFAFGVLNGASLTPGAYGVSSLNLESSTGERALFTRTEPLPFTVSRDRSPLLSFDLQPPAPTLAGPTQFRPSQTLRFLWRLQTADGWTVRLGGPELYHVTLTDPAGEVVVEETQFRSVIEVRLPWAPSEFYTLTVTRAASDFTPEATATVTLTSR